MYKNLSAGMGDPYWYEWLIGVYYALGMLPPDNDIDYVTLQAIEFQGLDDVVIGYKSGEISGIQVKHTRDSNSLTFYNLIYSTPSRISLLAELFTDWKKMYESGLYSHCNAILLTNRKGGIRNSTIGKASKNPVTLPALQTFWKDIKIQIANERCTNIDSISVEGQWQTAWNMFLNELVDSTDTTKLEFLKSFDIKTNQEDLDGYVENIKRKLFGYFKADDHQLIRFDQQLCYAIRDWSTTRRHSEKITREDLFEALSLAQDIPAGDHNLPVCFPFFQSRIDFIAYLEKNLQDRIRPIVFLSGEPGSGKTNIISYMSDKSNSVIDLRFHAFKPMQPGDAYLPSDHGLSDAKALWGDLLIQLRTLLKGRLAEFNVPISNEILGSFPKMREEVLRLANLYGKDQNRTIVIAIDGIDHAARSGSSNNFLETLVPPNGVPENVCFLIAGQPLQYYDLYPDWLSNQNAVLHCEVPSIEKGDIQQLLELKQINLNDCSQDRIAEIIFNAIKGNTLSAVFAVYECGNLTTLEELERRLLKVPFSSGIQAYYEYIWKEAKNHIPHEYWYIDTKIATVLSMYTKKVTAEQMVLIFPQIPLPETAWNRVFKSMFPIVIQDEDGYRVFHNDVRVYLQKYIRKDPADFQNTCLEIAEFLFSSKGNVNVRHELGFELLKNAKRQDLFLRYFTSEYVLDSIYTKRPLQEITDQLEDTIPQFSYSAGFTQQLSFECAVETLSQYQQSLQWQDTQHESDCKLPDILPCEKRVLNQALFSPSEISQMFEQVSWLADEGEICRAKDVIGRWLGELTPFTLVSKLAENARRKLDHDYVIKDNIKALIEEWGDISYRMNLTSFKSNGNELNKQIIAYWSKGWLKSAQRYYSPDFLRKWREKRTIAFGADIEKMFAFLLKNATREEILSFVQEIDISCFTYITKVYWVCWAIIHNEGEHCIQELEEILSQGIDTLEKHQYSTEDNKNFVCGVMIAFVCKLYGKLRIDDFDTFVSTLLEKSTGYKVKKGDRGYFAGNNLVLAGILLADIFSDLCTAHEFVDWDENLEIIIETIFDERDGIGCVEIGGTDAKRFLLILLLYLSDGFPRQFQMKIITLVTDYAKTTDMLTTINIWWPYLKRNGKVKQLFEIFEKWMAIGTGKAWNQELYEVHNIVNIILPLALDMGWKKEVQKVQNVLECNKVGYVGRKDYSLYKPLDWFESITKVNLPWQHPGIDFLNISEYASQTGDNRAAVRVEGAVAAVVGNKGITAIDAFIKTISPTSLGEFEIILDAIIESFANYHFSDSDIFTIWQMAVDILHIDHSLPQYDSNNSIKIIYLVDLREAINQYLDKSSENNRISLEKMMNDYSPFEYKIEKGPETLMFYLPNRWFYQETANSKAEEFKSDNMTGSIEDAFENLCELVEKKDNYRWDMAIGFLEMLRDAPVEKEPFINDLFNLIVQYRGSESWETDGIYRLYSKMWPQLNSLQKESLYGTLSTHYNNYKGWHDAEILPDLYLLSDDMHRMLLWQLPELSDFDKLDAIKALLSMHMSWITASGRRPFFSKYNVIEEETKATWKNICCTLREYLAGKI
jgi:hypothetical protein